MQHITKLNKELADAKVVKTNLENKLTNIQQAKLNLDQIREGLPTLELALPLGSDVTPYLRKIESFARKYKLSITAVQFSTVPLSKPEIGDDLRTKDLSYNLTLEGNFTNFRKFLKDLESFIRTSDVTTANLARDNGGVVKQALQITTYYLGEDSNAAGSVSSQSTSGGVNE
ncbi:MAG: type 4a pilus biogenesis protein PilO [Candidatus Woykebacteria bacterium]